MSVVPLPAGTTLGKSFEYGLDINLGSTASESWQPVRRISAWTPTYPPTTQDQATYDDLGAANEAVTARSFATSFTVQGNRSVTTGLFLPEVEALLAAAKATLDGATVDIRWYHKPEFGTPNPNDAGRASCRVEVTRQNSGNSEIEVFNVTLTGQGPFESITNPFAGWDVTEPVLAAVSPDEAVEGELVTLTGTGFLGATDVDFGGTPADEFVVANAATIIASLPTGTAGSVDVTVTTPGGTSNILTYTRG
ncbi:IPT/TIG domain-containing protein [Ruania suaedae]|uniref:phage tail tube protein n=1 Tax=Ruania suaedae TaxID=2897774 RepID=UPI001E3B1738|nr:IPT/TIG domain-containing protein [Ruania suaedae]UFU03435.1 IPT/TIG domain-containing protein [Ruania suaedae]